MTKIELITKKIDELKEDRKKQLEYDIDKETKKWFVNRTDELIFKYKVKLFELKEKEKVEPVVDPSVDDGFTTYDGMDIDDYNEMKSKEWNEEELQKKKDKEYQEAFYSKEIDKWVGLEEPTQENYGFDMEGYYREKNGWILLNVFKSPVEGDLRVTINYLTKYIDGIDTNDSNRLISVGKDMASTEVLSNIWDRRKFEYIGEHYIAPVKENTSGLTMWEYKKY